MSAPKLFGSSGIRGDAESVFTNQFCFDIGRTFGKFLKYHQLSGSIAVGMDPRSSSKRIKTALLQGLAMEEEKLFDEGITPIPAMNWLLKAAPFAGSVMVTGSHIQENQNGFKFFAFEEEISKKHEAEISVIYQKIAGKITFQKRKISVVHEDRAKDLYGEMLKNLAIKPFFKQKIIVDPGNGAQSEVMSDVLQALGFNLMVINNRPDPRYLLCRDTETEGVVALLQKLVLREQAILGIAFDADGDRVVFIDEKGRFIPGDYSGALLVKHSDTKLVVTPTNTSQVVEYLGKPVIRTKVGSPYVVEAMKKHGATFGFEANGGGFSAEIMMSRDGGSTAIKILNLMATSQKTLGDLIDELPSFHLWRLKVDCPTELNSFIIKKAREQFKGVKIEELDGLKIWLDKTTWILFRPSANAPEFRVFAEAKEESKAKKLAEEGINLVKTCLK